MVKVLVLLLCVTLSGCKLFIKPEPVIEYRDVLVPVPVYPDIPDIPKPTLKISEIDINTPDDEAVKLYQATIEQLKDYSNSLLEIIERVRKPSESRQVDAN